jgi:hypothetical protein
VGVQTEGSGTADVEYLEEGIKKAQEAVVDKIEEVYTDGAYHSPGNQEYCKEQGIEWVMRGIQGKPSKYDLWYDEEGNLVVVNKESGEQLQAKRSNRNTAEAPERWVIRDGGNRPIYFERKDVETCELRKRLEKIPKERLDLRNNVEATIFQVGYHYRGDKSQYRGQIKHLMWAVSRCIWVNFRRIQLWSIRKGGDRGTDIPKVVDIFNFLRRLPGYWYLLRPPMFAA